MPSNQDGWTQVTLLFILVCCLTSDQMSSLPFFFILFFFPTILAFCSATPCHRLQCMHVGALPGLFTGENEAKEQ